ncbi:MAG: protein translocase subunit SecD [Deltaproteobacteria bacterium]|nr:protein translocase subunit SecD [Deltaproteobacteria bacterium]
MQMPKEWKWKFWLFLGLTVLSVYLLVPTFAGFQALREEAETKNEKVPWYVDLFPDKGINLGLDLRGGIYMEFEVELARAIENKIDVILDGIRYDLKNKNIPFASAEQNRKEKTIVIIAADDAQLRNIENVVAENYKDTLVRKAGGEALHAIFTLDAKYLDYLKDQISKQALEKVRNRIDRYGVSEPSIQRLGSNRIAVELPGIKNPERAVTLIKKAGQLEFKIVDDTVASTDFATMLATARETAGIAQNDYSVETARKLTELLTDKLPAETEIAFETRFDPIAKKIVGGTPYVLKRKVEVSGEMLKNAQTNVQNNEPYVSLTFDPQGAERFGETTKTNVGKRMAIVLDGVVMSSPVIREAILGGQAQITLGYGAYKDLLKEAEDLVLVLQEGALPAQLTEATKTVVGPTLGADSIREGVMATLVGGLIVGLFMLIYYKGSGLLANAALFFNFLFILAALALFQATLTLPGIAGIALTLGMAVDANILIFERIREELRAGKRARQAIEAGYHNAMRTIIDSNVTTLISGIVLYQFGTGPIKGFAVTLIIGLTISMYTACVCTRMVYEYLLVKRQMTKVSV